MSLNVNTVRGFLEVRADESVGNDEMVWSTGLVEDFPGAGAFLETLDKMLSQTARGYSLQDQYVTLSPENLSAIEPILWNTWSP